MVWLAWTQPLSQHSTHTQATASPLALPRPSTSGAIWCVRLGLGCVLIRGKGVLTLAMMHNTYTTQQALRFLRREGILPSPASKEGKEGNFVGGAYVCEGSVGDENQWRT